MRKKDIGPRIEALQAHIYEGDFEAANCVEHELVLDVLRQVAKRNALAAELLQQLDALDET